jgi:esterase
MSTRGLHSVQVGEEGPHVVFLHGLFGQGKNWTSIAKALADSYRVLLVDLPNHGRSAWTEHISYPEVASSVGDLIEARRNEDGSRAPVAVVGHSMGGKVAMAIALLRPALVERLCVVDVSPVRYSTLSNFEQFLRGMRQLDLDRLPDRAVADQALATYVPDGTVRSFLLQNLRRQPISAPEGGSSGAAWRWQLNIELIEDQLGELGDWPTELTGPFLGPTLWVAGEDSRYVLSEYAPAMRKLFPRVQLVTVKKSGHWVHSDQPEVFLAILRRFLRVSDASQDNSEDGG